MRSFNPRREARARAAGGAVLAVVATLGIAACGSSSKKSTTSGSSTSNSSSGKHLTIALVPGLTTDPFYITMHNGAAAEAKKLGVTLTWQGAATWSTSQQLPVVNALLAEHPSALLIAPTDVEALRAPIQKFVSAGIPVITVDTTINDTSILTSRITSDNIQGGEVAAAAIAKLANYKGSVAVNNTVAGVSTTDERQQGFLEGIKKYPNMKVVAVQYNNDSATTAESQVRNLLLAHPDLVGIFATNLYAAQGAGAAISSAGKSGKVFVAGYDPEPATVKLLKAGTINILVAQQPAKEGQLAVLYAYDKLMGKPVPTSTLVPNIVATTATASDPNITKYFYQSSLSSN